MNSVDFTVRHLALLALLPNELREPVSRLARSLAPTPEATLVVTANVVAQLAGPVQDLVEAARCRGRRTAVVGTEFSRN